MKTRAHKVLFEKGSPYGHRIEQTKKEKFDSKKPTMNEILDEEYYYEPEDDYYDHVQFCILCQNYDPDC